MDLRLEWLQNVLVANIRRVSTTSFNELLQRDSDAEDACASFFETDISKNPMLIFTATEGDFFDFDDDDDNNDDNEEICRSRQQKIELRTTFIPNLNVAGSNSSRQMHCVFFTKTNAIPIREEDVAENLSLLDSIEVVVTVVPSLLTLHAILENAFLPLIEDSPAAAAVVLQHQLTTYEASADAVESGGAASSVGKKHLYNEVLTWVRRLNQHIGGFINQVCAERKLPMPVTPIVIGESDADIKAAASNDDIIKDIDSTVSLWHAEISSALAQEPQKEGPLGEIEYWKEKYSALSALYEQINSPKVKSILKVAAEAECNAWHSISGTIAMLVRHYAEAKDNVKFLSTLDRHFRTIQGVVPDSGSLQPIIDTMSSMMMAIRMVWIISRYFNTEEKMITLLEKIAAQIAQKVSQHIHFNTILSERPDEAKRKIKEGHQVLLKWKSAYTTVQEEINQSEKEQHWVFDNKRLFDKTDYMAERCEELQEIVSIIEYYNAVLGSQLKLVVTETSGLEKIMKDVEKLKRPIETLTFDPFDRKAVHNWHVMYSNFKSSVATLDQHLSQFIQRIFDDDLRSAESAFELLQSFKNMHSRIGGDVLDMNQLMAAKADKILHQYHNEIERVKKIFEQNCDKPPLTKNQPPIAGSIHWSSSLYQRLKKPIVRFQEEDMLYSSYGKRVKTEYVEMARMMKDYATARYEKWREDVKNNIDSYLKAKILKKDADDVYVVNFNNNLFQIIKEAKYLDRLGFDIPSEALNVTLQDEQYHNYVENLKAMLQSFNRELAIVEGPERLILGRQIKELKNALQAGFTELNWISLGINDFVIACNKAITHFRNLSREVRKSADHIQTQVINKIAACQLLPDTSEITYGGDFPELQHVVDSVERCCQERIEACVRAYCSVPPLLIKIETQITNGNTGKCPLLENYYAHWEHKIWKALLKLVLNSLSRLATLLGCHKNDSRNKNRLPLFKVVFGFTSEPVYTPNQQEIMNTILKISQNTIASTKLFVRWMRGTCIDYTAGTLTSKPSEESNDPLFSFYTDIEHSPYVRTLQERIRKVVQSRASDLEAKKRNLKEDKYRSVYVTEKKLKVDAQLKDQLHWLDYESKFQSHHNEIAEFDTEHITDIGFVRCDEGPCFNVLIDNLNEWIRLDGSQLNGIARIRMTQRQQKIEKFVKDLQHESNGVEGLKFVLETMDEAMNANLEMEMDYREIEFIYDSVQYYGFNISEDEMVQVRNLRASWEAVMDNMKVIDLSLAPKKAEFRTETKNEAVSFMNETKKYLADFRSNGPSRADINLADGVKLKNKWRADVRNLQIKREQLAKAEKLFGLPLSTFIYLQDINEELSRVELVYELYEQWIDNLKRWNRTSWKDLVIEDMQKATDDKVKQARIMSKTHGKVEPFTAIQQMLLNFHSSLPLLTKLKSPALKNRHWKELMRVTKREFSIDNITLDDLVAMEVYKFSDNIDVIVLAATRELGVEKEIQAIKDFWAAKEFVPVKYAPRGVVRCHVLSDTSEIQEAVDDNILKIKSLANVKWVQPFIEDVKIWERKLSTISDVIVVWVQVQMKWQYLESIFKGSEDIVIQLPKEAARFNDLDKKWIRIMNDTVSASNVDLCCNVPDRLIELKYIDEKLDECQKDLANYLESKRCIFPRFYFISDDELLSILASSGARSVQDHMLKMFDNCAQLVFKGSSEVIEGVDSQEKENLIFDNVVNTAGVPAENWLNIVLSESKSTLRNIIKAAVFYYPKMDRLEWVKKYHGMINLCGCKIWWTFQIEDAFAKVKKGKKGAVKDLSAQLSMQLAELVEEMDKDIDKQYRKKINTLIIVDVHGRDIVDRFVRDSVLDAREFEWESQLRFYWEKQPDTCQLRQCTGTFDYGYEYMGLNGRLVITPLTDRCFMTLTQALTFYLGGAPGGPAGTGKTESVKDLAKAMSIQCVVFNCGEGLDYKAMWSIFSGLSQAGSWGCFDEFNRIELPVLSVVSEQLRSIQGGLRNHQERFMFGDKEIQLVSTVGIFITMNPGYAGRVELPDNLKALFRPVVMAVPDMELIAENMLFSEGFTTARELAKKMVTLYSLARGQLSKQHHYDWGLRALKAVLVMAGQLKRGSPDLAEKSVLMRALRDMNAPKFIAEDEPLFKGLIGDLFPGLDPTRVPQENLAKAASKALRENGYKVDIKQVDKVVQLYETMQTRHTSMVVGPTGGGKSVVINTLRRAQDDLKLPTKIFIINPKAQPTTMLYGILDPMTRNWTDGIFSNIFRQMNRVTENERERRYVVFDGDVDAKWVEDMNSVMDDNKLLTLPNGERIRLHPCCSILFEVGDLQYASPATVSRVGMVYLDPINLGWQPFAYSWKHSRNRDELETLNDLFDQYVQPLINFILEGIVEDTITAPPKIVIPISDLNMVRQLCTMIQTIVTSKVGVPEPKNMQSIFIFCCVWSFGALINNDSDRVRFDQLIKKISGWPLQDSGENYLTRFVGSGSLPERQTLYEYFFDLEDNRWKPWQTLTKPFSRPADGKFSSILVSTVDTERGMWLLDKIVTIRTPVMLVGESGTAKTVTIQAYLRSLKNRVVEQHDDEINLEEMLLEMNFSSRTTSLDAQRTLEDNIEKRTNVVLGPPAKKRLLVFIDDINMPKVDTYGTQQPIAFLKLLLEHSSLYDRKDLLFKNVRDTQFLAAMAPPGGGRNALDPRFMSLFTVFNVVFPSNESLNTIYLQILEDAYSNVSEELTDIAPKMTSMTLSSYKSIVAAMPATPTKFHYIFNLRDLSRIYEGLCRVTIDKFPGVDSVVRLWRNEIMRIFADRMSDENDKKYVNDLVERQIHDNFPGSVDIALANPLLFGDFGDFEPDSENKRLHLYEDFGHQYGTVRTLVEEILEEINTPVIKMDLVMFDMALEHLLRIVRVISIDRGHCLLVGVGGSGKQSLTKLAAAICQMSIFEVVLSRGYNEDLFREDLKKLFFKIGVDRQKVVFLFTDNHVKKESFLELINNMLASGMVPALYPEEEKEPLYQSVMDEINAQNLAPSKDNKWSFFVNRCRDNLHVVLSMSPSGDVLRTRCRNFPSLINNTTIDWFNKWPAQALEAVANKILAKENLPDYLRPAITEHTVHVHLTADELSVKYLQQLKRHNYVTPKNFLAFLANYSLMLAEKRDMIDDIVAKYKTGLERLQKASEDVAVMGKELAGKEVDLANKTQLNDAMMKEIMASKQQNETRTAEVVQLEEELNIKGKDIAEESAQAKVILDEAMPEFDKASEAVNKISKDDINELKAFANPQAIIKAVVQMVCIFNDEPPTWEAGKIMMNNPTNFVKELKSEALRERLDQKKMVEVAKIKKQFPDINWLEKLTTASKAAFGLMTWVEALSNYYQVARLVKPKEARVAQLMAEQAAAEASLQRCREEIDHLQANQRALEERLAAGQAEARKLEQEAAIMKRRLNAAKRLITGFTSERHRWQQEMTDLREARNRLVGDCLAAAAFVSYLGAFTFHFREEAFKEQWLPDFASKQIPLTENFKVRNLLTDEVETSRWASDGLPGDDLSIQNGVLTKVSTTKLGKGKKAGKVRFPLCIDPQMQAVNWIKRQHADNSRFEVASFSDPDFLKRLEFAIQYGNPFLFENVDEFIDPIVDAVLDPVFKEDSGGKMIRLGDKEIGWDENFKLYLCTKIANPNYPAEVFGKTLVINYGVTEDGLENQLLNFVVASERSDLQKQSEELVQTMAENRAQLKQLEDSLIRELTLATGNILDNDELIATLENTKSSATEVEEKLTQAKETARITDISRQEYRPAAKRGATLYFVISQLSAINSMYEYSLGAFLSDVFSYSIAKSEPSFEIATRLQNIITSLTYNLYCYVCMGIFERHKLMLSFQIACRLLNSHDLMDHDELEFFLRGCVLASKDFPAKPFTWLSERQWNDVCKLSQTKEVFKDLVEHITANHSEWQEWIGLDRPEDPKFTIPNGYSDILTVFQRLCLLRCFRPDRVYVAAAQFISNCEMMGERFTVPPILKYKDVFDKSSSMSPIVCIVSPGANPTDEIIKLAEKEVGTDKLRSISLGQGQGEEAMKMVELGSIRGHWVLLQNCHLLITWMKDLEKIIEKRDQNPPHLEFRLWLTTEPSLDFPMGVLQRSLKVVNEPPNGLKMNMKNTLSKVTEEQLDACPHPAFRPLVYTLSFFHAVVQERRKYGKIGWNVIYDFNETDFTISMRLLDTYLAKAYVNNDPIPWETLRYLVGEAMYGGRVTDNVDRRTVAAYLEEYFGDFLFDTFQLFHFFNNNEVDYALPPGSSNLNKRVLLAAMNTHVDEMPNENQPDVFGLHPNAETGYLKDASELMWANLIDLMPRSAKDGHSGESHESLLQKLTEDILAQVPSPFDRKQVMKSEKEKAKAVKDENLQPVQVVLLQEIERWNNLVNNIVLTLRNLQKALAGVIGMSADLDDLASSLNNGQLPAPWRRLAPATRKNLGRWLAHFQKRHEQYQHWITEGEPKVMWLSGLMIPDSYISALVQITCRKYVWPLDRSTTFTTATKYATSDEVTERPKDGAYVSGLYLEGARWDSKKMCLTPQEKKVLIYDMPVMHIIPTETSKLKLVGTFRTPVYVTRDRRSAAGVGMVFEVDLASEHHASHWILESVALCLNSDD